MGLRPTPPPTRRSRRRAGRGERPGLCGVALALEPKDAGSCGTRARGSLTATGSPRSGVQLQRDAVGVAKLQQHCPTQVLDAAVLHAQLVQLSCGCVHRVEVAQGKAEVVQPDAVFVEAVTARRYRAQAEQPWTQVVDDAAVEETEALPGLLVRVGWYLEGHRQGEHLVVEGPGAGRSEEHTSELQSRQYLVCRLLLEKKNKPPRHRL